MTDQSATLAGASTAPRPRLEPDAIGVAQDTVIGMASSAPAATIGLSLALLAGNTAYGSGPILILTAIPMLIIANAYRRCNMWNANCGASFEWVGRAINPYLGFLTGWLMVVAYIIGTVAEILLLGPSVLAVFGSTSTNTWAWIGIGTAVGAVMLVIAVIGIRITARVQVGMAAGRVPDSDRDVDLGPGIRPRLTTLAPFRSPGTGSASPALTARALRCPASLSRSSSTAAGTARCMLTRKSSIAGSTRAARPSSPSRCSRSSTPSRRSACRASSRRASSRTTPPTRWSTWRRHSAAGPGPR